MRMLNYLIELASIQTVGLRGFISTEEGIVRTCSNMGKIWSSARVVRRRVKSFNERNPYLVLNCSRETAWVTRRKAGMTSSPHGPYTLGDTRATMEPTTGRQVARRSKSLKRPPSSD